MPSFSQNIIVSEGLTLWERLNKPDPFGALQQILSDRGIFYENACHFSILTDGKIAEDVASEILEMLRSRG